MNNYGVHLNIVGMRNCMDEILHNVLQPLAMAIYMNDHKDVHSKAHGTKCLRLQPEISDIQNRVFYRTFSR